MSKHLKPHYILSRVEYNPELGTFRFKSKKEISNREVTWNRRYAGQQTGGNRTIHTNRRLMNGRIWIDDRCYRAARIAFLCMTGRFPHQCVDHVNGDVTDNRWVNLREANYSDNCSNRHTTTSNTGIKGIRYTAPSYLVDIKYAGIRYRKSFRKFADAIIHYKEKALEIQGIFAVMPAIAA